MGRFRKSYCPHGKEIGANGAFCSACRGLKEPRIREGVYDGKGRPKRNQAMAPSLQRRKGK